ncbi:hypothetical protein AALP_AA2G252200 [Arabis alpina]|uniref:nucleoside-diphosphate kinase n=1 Tax=Arabis alpina TaxID=50452 RepID=A0A087HJV1_ARAAL|nr:hypothetical protein AALP_AA2G252200 [Arabis alpina]
MGRTFILIKPDGVKMGLVGEIICKFNGKGLTMKGLKMITVDRPFAEKHHQNLPKHKLRKNVDYMISGPVVAMIWEGTNVVSIGKKLIRKTIHKPSDLDRDIGSKLIHGSDSLESAFKETALWFPDEPVKVLSDAAEPKASDIGRISVTGFDPDEDVESALREHFASCGNITDLFIRQGSGVAYIYFVGEGAVDKALQLNGSDLGGWKVCAKAYPFKDHWPVLVSVKGYDPSLTDSEIEIAARDLFSSCGVVKKVCILKGFTVVYIKGFDAAEKAMNLSGCVIGRRKVLVEQFTRPPRYTVHSRRGRVTNPPRPAGFNSFARFQK